MPRDFPGRSDAIRPAPARFPYNRRPMFRLTREVRFAVNPQRDGQSTGKPTNSYAGFPSLTGLGHYFALRVSVSGPLDPASQYLINIKRIDTLVREHGVPLVESAVRTGGDPTPPKLVGALFDRLWVALPAVVELDEVSLSLSPFLTYGCLASELPMVRLSQKFEFSATHRLHNPALSDRENCDTYGKCNNPHGHGHNYEVQVTLKGSPDQTTGVLVDVPAFERIVAATVIDRFDHKNLNVEVPEFREIIPSVENIARVIYRLLKPTFSDSAGKLASVTVWETPKTWCEYAE